MKGPSQCHRLRVVANHFRNRRKRIYLRLFVVLTPCLRRFSHFLWQPNIKHNKILIAIMLFGFSLIQICFLLLTLCCRLMLNVLVAGKLPLSESAFLNQVTNFLLNFQFFFLSSTAAMYCW